MTRLALYDKKYGAVDRKKNNYFRWDYIYFRNFWTRLGVFFGCMIIALFYALNKIIVEQVDVFELDLRAEAAKIGFYTIAALVLYTIIGTLVASAEYKKSKERLDAYFMMLKMLDGEAGDDESEASEDVEHGQYGNYANYGNADSYDVPQERDVREGYGYLPPEYDDYEPPVAPPRRTFSGMGAPDGDDSGFNKLKKLKGVNGDGDERSRG